MKIDLNKGAYLQIGGELGKFNSIPIDTLIKLAQDFQKLILTIAKYDLSTEEAIDLNNFRIELTGFKEGSAIPVFAYSRRGENQVGLRWQDQRNQVNEKLDKLIEISSNETYPELKVVYPEPVKRNPIVENLYEFVNDFGTAPVFFIDYKEKGRKITPLYKINRFKTAAKNQLIAEIKEEKDLSAETDEGYAKIKITKKRGRETHKIMHLYTKENISLDFSPELIVTEQRIYHLNYPLRCLLEQEDNYFVIQSEMLGLIGTGNTEDEAEKSFSDEFDFIFQRYNSLKESELTNNVKMIKTILNHYVNHVEE